MNMAITSSGNCDPNTALGRAAIAVAHCGDETEIGCNMCGHMVFNKVKETGKPRATCKNTFVAKTLCLV